jgi:hypothetical protein
VTHPAISLAILPPRKKLYVGVILWEKAGHNLIALKPTKHGNIA